MQNIRMLCRLQPRSSSSTTCLDLGDPRRPSQPLIRTSEWSQDHPGPLIDPPLVICGLWRIWKCRNRAVFEGILIPPCAALELLSQQVWEIADGGGQTVQQLGDKQRPEREIQVCWVKPPFRTIKVNCDVAWCNQIRLGGCGCVARVAGIFQAGGGMGNLFCGSSLMEEAEAVRMAMLACVELGLQIVQVETDLKVLVDMINGNLVPEAALEGILWDIKVLRQQL